MQQACFSVAIIDDTIVEATEEFTLQLSTDDSQVRLTTERAVVSILDNDGEKRALKLLMFEHECCLEYTNCLQWILSYHCLVI